MPYNQVVELLTKETKAYRIDSVLGLNHPTA